MDLDEENIFNQIGVRRSRAPLVVALGKTVPGVITPSFCAFPKSCISKSDLALFAQDFRASLKKGIGAVDDTAEFFTKGVCPGAQGSPHSFALAHTDLAQPAVLHNRQQQEKQS